MLEELKVLKRIAVRGRNLALVQVNSRMVDMWEHMETEVDRLIKRMTDETKEWIRKEGG